MHFCIVGARERSLPGSSGVNDERLKDGAR